MVVRALGAGAVPLGVAPRSTRRSCAGDGDVGLPFEPGDVDTLTAQLERLIRDAGCARACARGAQRVRDARLVARRRELEAVYDDGGRPAPRPTPAP